MHIYIHTLMVVAAMQGVGVVWGSVSRRADQGNRTQRPSNTKMLALAKPKLFRQTFFVFLIPVGQHGLMLQDDFFFSHLP